MDTLSLFNGCQEFKIGDEILHFVSFHEGSKKIVYWEHEKSYGENTDTCKHMSISHLSFDILKELCIWDKLTPEDQERHGNGGQKRIQEIKERTSEGTGKKRVEKHPNVPEELTCITCNKTQKIVKSVLVARVEKQEISLEDYIKGFQCQACNPTKGRKANPKYAHLPKELVCKCGNKVATSAGAIVAKAEKLKITPEEVVKQYVCQTCNPTKGRKKGKKGNKGKRKKIV